LVVDHEIVAKQFETIRPIIFVDFVFDTIHSEHYYFLHSFDDFVDIHEMVDLIEREHVGLFMSRIV